MLEHGLSAAALRKKHGIEKEDIIGMHNRLLMVVKTFTKKITKDQHGIIRKLPVRNFKIGKQRIPKLQSYTYIPIRRRRRNAVFNRKLSDSKFPFSLRLLNTLRRLEMETVKDLIEIAVVDFLKFSGFGPSYMDEFIAFIEFERLEAHFTGFAAAK